MNLSKLLELTIASRIDFSKSLELEQLIKQEILLTEANKKGGNTEKTRLKHAQNYIKKVISDKLKENLHGVSYQNDYQCFVNGYTAIRTKRFIDGLKEVETEPLNFNNIFPDYTSNDSDFIKLDETIDIPSLKLQLKEAMAEEKASNKKNFQSLKRMFKLGSQWFSVELFLDILNIIPNDKNNYEFYQYRENSVNPLIIVSGNDDAIILPIKYNEDEVDQAV